jgi:hypothetical protein
MTDVSARRPAELKAKETASRLADKYVGRDGGEPSNAPAAHTRTEWAERITNSWGKTTEGFIQIGAMLLQAKIDLGHGNWQEMVRSDLPFGLRKAEMLMAIARDQRLVKSQTLAILPPSYPVLYEITKLDDPTFAAMVREGSINADMTKLVADSPLWLEKHRKGARLKKLPKKLAKAPPKKPKDAAPPRPQPLSPDTAKDLHAFVTKLAAYMRDAPPNVASSRALPAAGATARAGRVCFRGHRLADAHLRGHVPEKRNRHVSFAACAAKANGGAPTCRQT